jgi:hypothetical protein
MGDKVLVVMNYDDNVKEFSDLAFLINKEYCDKRGYGLKRFNKIFDSNLYMPFQKVWLLVEVIEESMKMNDYTHVVWIDSDACFNKNSFHTLTDFLPRNDRWTAFSEDMQRWSVFPQGGVSINTGVMIFRVCQESIQLLQKVINRIHTMAKPIPFFEQGAFMDLIYSRQISMKGIMFFPYNTIQTFPETTTSAFPPSFFDSNALIYHFPNATKANRIQYMEKLL